MNKDSGHTGEKVPMLESFYKSQISSILATAVDFIVYLFLERLCGIPIFRANVIGASSGAIVSFFLGRHWAFRRKDKALKGQAFRYAITSALSVLINSYSMVWLTEDLGVHDIISKIIVAIIVGMTFNYFMFRYFVYR